MTELAWAGLSSPVGPLAVGCTPAGVARLDFRGPGGAGRRQAGQASTGQASTAPAQHRSGQCGAAECGT